MSDSQANVPSLSEPIASDQAAQGGETDAKIDTSKDQNEVSKDRYSESTSIQPATDTAAEQTAISSNVSQLTSTEEKDASQTEQSDKYLSNAEEGTAADQIDEDTSAPANASESQARVSVPSADTNSTNTVNRPNDIESDKGDPQHGTEASENFSNSSDLPVKQEETQNQAPAPQSSANEEPEEGEYEQTSADAKKDAEESRTDAEPTSINSQVKVEVPQTNDRIPTQVNPEDTISLQPVENEDESNETAHSKTLNKQENEDGTDNNASELVSSTEQNGRQDLRHAQVPPQSATEDVEMKESAAEADTYESKVGDALTTSTSHATVSEIEKPVPVQPPTSFQENISESGPEPDESRVAEGSKPKATQEDNSAPAPAPAPEDVSTPVTRTRAPQEPTSSSVNINGITAGPSGRKTPNTRQDEMARIRKENEDMRLLWLSLPSHDHPSYYSDTDEENASSGSSCAADALLPRSASGRAPFLNGDRAGEFSMRQKRKKDQWSHNDKGNDSDLDDDDDDDNDDDDDIGRSISQSEKQYRIGNRGNKLRKNSRWVRKHKLGTSTDARTEKDITERFTDRLKALQRTQVESMLNNAPGPSLLPIETDMLEGSDRLLLKDIHHPHLVEETSILLAPQLLRPILSTRALLQSHTLRHTFRNPHIGALSRTALDLRESESQISRSLARCLKAMEARISSKQTALVNGDRTHVNGIITDQADIASKTRIPDEEMEIDPHAVGVEGTQGTDDELNPSFAQLDRLFVTKEGLPIPFGGQAGEEGAIERTGEGLNGDEQQTILTADQQREVIRAALECLHELGGDSLEYVERLEEVRSRLAAVKQKRLKVWNALRIWALKREGDDFEKDHGANTNENDALTEAAAAVATNATVPSNPRSGPAGSTKTNSTTTNTSTAGTKRRRVAA